MDQDELDDVPRTAVSCFQKKLGEKDTRYDGYVYIYNYIYICICNKGGYIYIYIYNYILCIYQNQPSLGIFVGGIVFFFVCFHILGRIIPTDELIFFQRGSNHQAVYLYLIIRAIMQVIIN